MQGAPGDSVVEPSAPALTDPALTDPPVAPEVLELELGAVAAGGSCVARAPDGRVVFVRHGLPGERVRAVVTAATRSFLRADAVEVLAGSPERVEPPCPWAGPGRCGGCDWQHATLPAQRALKADVVREQLQRLGGVEVDVEVEAVPVPDHDEDDGLGWRTRVHYAVDRSARAGLRAHRSHRVVPVDTCRIASPAVAQVPGGKPTVYVGSYDSRFYALDAKTGKVRWKRRAPGRISGAATVVGDIVYFGDLRWRSVGTVGSGSVHTFENDTGPDDANHAPYGLLIASGPGVAPRGPVEGMQLMDVTPTVLRLFGLDVPDSLQGRVIDAVVPGAAVAG